MKPFSSKGVFWNDEHKDYYGRDVRDKSNRLSRYLIANEFLEDYHEFEPGKNLPRWFPQPGDIMITKVPRNADSVSPGGFTTLYKDPDFFLYPPEARELRPNKFFFRSGDIVVRLGKFTTDWKWSPSAKVEAYTCDLRQGRPWWLVARARNNTLHRIDYPQLAGHGQLQGSSSRAAAAGPPAIPGLSNKSGQLVALNSVDPSFAPRNGDLVLRVVPGEHLWGLFWWNYTFIFAPCDLVVRAGSEARANGTCMVVSLFYREPDDRSWSFRGQDIFTFPFTPLPDMI